MTNQTIRVDKWLWFARFFKSRNQASKMCISGKIRLNNRLIQKANSTLKKGDVLTFPKEDNVRVIKVISLANRRGPAKEAVNLFKDLEPPKKIRMKKRYISNFAIREPGTGRPTKANRRAIDKLRDSTR